jgi:hypothetical protein
MVMYQFYLHNETNRNEFIGTLPERRSNPERINQNSIMNWATKIFSGFADVNNIFFVQVTY